MAASKSCELVSWSFLGLGMRGALVRRKGFVKKCTWACSEGTRRSVARTLVYFNDVACYEQGKCVRLCGSIVKIIWRVLEAWRICSFKDCFVPWERESEVGKRRVVIRAPSKLGISSNVFAASFWSRPRKFLRRKWLKRKGVDEVESVFVITLLAHFLSSLPYKQNQVEGLTILFSLRVCKLRKSFLRG